MTLLIVDDEARIRDLIRKYAAFEGYNVEEASNGMEAIEKCRQKNYDLIIMDVMMPVLDGYQATGIIRASERPDAGVPVIAMTANAFVEDRQRAREAGMTEHLPKPLDQAVLVQTLQRWKKE